MARIRLGLPQLEGKLSNYQQRYDMVELDPLDARLPADKKLGAWREAVPPHFAFSVLLPESAILQGAGWEAELERALEVARLLAARVLLLATTPAVRPTKRNKDRVAALRKRVPEGHIAAWEARGIWEQGEAIAAAHDAGWLPVFDAAQVALPPGPLAYTRVRALGHATQLGADRIAHLAEQLLDRREAFVVADRPLAARVKRGLADLDGAGRSVPMIFRPAVDLVADDEEQ